jgi:hypothetical protein
MNKNLQIALGLGLIGYAAYLLNQQSKKNMGVTTKPQGEDQKGFMNLAGSSPVVVGGVAYTCRKGELLQDASGNLGCFIYNPTSGDLDRVGNPVAIRQQLL